MKAMLSILLLLIGMIGMPIGGGLYFSSPVPASITAGGFIPGWTLRDQIAAELQSFRELSGSAG